MTHEADGAVLRFCERSSHYRLHSEELEEVRRHDLRCHALGKASLHEIEGSRRVRGHSLEDVALPLPGQVIGKGNVGFVHGGIRLVHLNEPVGISHGKRANEEPVQHAEETRGGSDGQRENQHGYPAHKRRARERPESEPEVLPGRVQVR